MSSIELTRERAVAALLEAHGTGRLLRAEPFVLNDDTQAYVIQAAVADKLGHRSGWKVALDAAGKVIHAPLYAERTYPSPATLKRSHFTHFLVEAELAITFSRAMPPRPERYSREDVQNAAGYIHPAFEIVDTRFNEWPHVDPLWLLADGLSHGCFVLGRGVELKKPGMLSHAHYQLKIDDVVVQDAKRAHPQPDPWETLTELVNLLQVHDLGIGEGDVVTTGSFSGVTPLESGQQVEVCFTGVGCSQLSLKS